MTAPVAVLGAGGWGTALADLIARKDDGREVRLWAYEPEVVAAINREHVNPEFLPGVPLSPRVVAMADACEAIRGAPIIVSAAPSHALRSVLARVRDAVPAGTLIVSATKGLETDSLALMSQVIRSALPQVTVAALSGPSFAIEVAQGQPTAVVLASETASDVERAQQLLATPRFRIYSSSDVIGVELGGALKNVIAIAAGILEGIGLGANARAALITRGLAEITRLGAAMGAEPLTFAGLAGMGDLILTATGELSRNRALGFAIASGVSFEDYRTQHRSVAEGANASLAGAQLGARLGVELPITEQVCQVLFEGKPARDGVEELMARDLKAEQWR